MLELYFLLSMFSEKQFENAILGNLKLYSRYYAEARNERQGPSPRPSASATQLSTPKKRRSGSEPLAILGSI